MSSVLARYEVSGERRNPKPSGSTSRTPPPKSDSPFFACCFSSAKMRSGLRMRFAPSISFELPTSVSSDTCLELSSDKCMALEGGVPERRGCGLVAAVKTNLGRSGNRDVARIAKRRPAIQIQAVRRRVNYRSAHHAYDTAGYRGYRRLSTRHAARPEV